MKKKAKHTLTIDSLNPGVVYNVKYRASVWARPRKYRLIRFRRLLLESGTLMCEFDDGKDGLLELEAKSIERITEAP